MTHKIQIAIRKAKSLFTEAQLSHMDSEPLMWLAFTIFVLCMVFMAMRNPIIP